MIHSVFELGDTIAREVMVPRNDVVYIERYKNLRQTALAVPQERVLPAAGDRREPRRRPRLRLPQGRRAPRLRRARRRVHRARRGGDATRALRPRLQAGRRAALGDAGDAPAHRRGRRRVRRHGRPDHHRGHPRGDRRRDHRRVRHRPGRRGGAALRHHAGCRRATRSTTSTRSSASRSSTRTSTASAGCSPSTSAGSRSPAPTWSRTACASRPRASPVGATGSAPCWSARSSRTRRVRAGRRRITTLTRMSDPGRPVRRGRQARHPGPGHPGADPRGGGRRGPRPRRAHVRRRLGRAGRPCRCRRSRSASRWRSRRARGGSRPACCSATGDAEVADADRAAVADLAGPGVPLHVGATGGSRSRVTTTYLTHLRRRIGSNLCA